MARSSDINSIELTTTVTFILRYSLKLCEVVSYALSSHAGCGSDFIVQT